MSAKKHRWIAFVGPTLPASEARRFGCEVRPPARQGDVWRAITDHPRALVLIDGVFESQPSVWHHELRAALASGIAVFGASSMGALRAAELWREGMIGVGGIFRSYRDGKRVDDADVALLHADAEHQFRPLTLPLVNVEHAARLARSAKQLTAAQARRLVELARKQHYQQRTWSSLCPGPAFDAWLKSADVDLKAADAREGLAAAKAWVASGAPAPNPRAVSASSHVRRRRLVDALPGALEKAQQAPDAEALADAGTRRLLLAGWARSIGLIPDRAAVARWLTKIPVRNVAADDRVRIAENCALEEVMILNPGRWLADGPTRLEGLGEQAMLLGRWKK